MSLQLPVLDDIDFDQLLTLAETAIAKKSDLEWSAASEGDPGRMLIEVFCFLSDQTIYRLNRLPRKVYIAFLRLLGVTLHPPAAAEATLEFMAPPLEEEAAGQPQPAIQVPRGTRVTTSATGEEGSAPVFVTLEVLDLPVPPSGAPPHKDRVRARHCTWVQGEVLGVGSGHAGLSLQIAQPPIVASFGPDHAVFDVRVWVETDPEQGGQRLEERPDDPRTYVQWGEEPGFTARTRGQPVYTVDRLSGTIQFAPAVRLESTLDDGRTRLEDRPRALAAVPGQGKQILVSYASGGGARGNVLPGTLTRILDPILLISPQPDGEPVTEERPADVWVKVTNPDAARGGRDAETLDNALLRGPLALYGQEQAVTARDYERIVQGAAVGGRGEIAQARALTKRDRWAYAEPGTVEVLMVPAPQETAAAEGSTEPEKKGSARPDVSLDSLARWAKDVNLASIDAALTQHAALGTRHELKWASYKPVDVRASVIIDEDQSAPRSVLDAVLERLNQYINPFYDPRQPDKLSAPPGATEGWPFGRSLHLREIETLIQETPGVAQVRDLGLRFPGPSTGVRSLAPDPYHPGTWYAGSQGLLYRSLNGGIGWEAKHEFEGERILAVRLNPDHPGLLALVTQVAARDASDAGAASTASATVQARVHVSTDCGETWIAVTDCNYPVQDLGWLLRANMTTILLLATDQGLYEYELFHERRARPRLDIPSLVPVDPDDPKAPLYTLTVLRGQRGQARVAVALKSRGGVYLSSSADLIPDKAVRTAQAESDDGGPTPSIGTPFRRLSALDGYDVRHLAAQQAGQRSYLWAGTMAEGNEARGCYRLQLGNQVGEWFDVGWEGGSCRALAFEGSWVYAATQWGGILKLDLGEGGASGWQESTQRDTSAEPRIPSAFLRFLDDQREDYDLGYRPDDKKEPSGAEEPAGSSVPASEGSEADNVPAAAPEGQAPGDTDDAPGDTGGRDVGNPSPSDGPKTPAASRLYREYKPLWTIAADASGTLMAAGEHGILRRLRRQDADPDAGPAEEGPDRYEVCSATEVSRRSYRNRITLPYDGLFVSGTHDVRQARPDEDAPETGRAGNAQP